MKLGILEDEKIEETPKKKSKYGNYCYLSKYSTKKKNQKYNNNI